MPRDARFIGPVDRILYLQSTANLGDIGPEALYALAHRLQERFFKKGSLLLEEGKLCDRVFLLVEGRVSLRRTDRTYRTLSPPGSAGLLAALSQNPAGTEARAEDDCLVLEMTIDDFWNATEDSFELLMSVIRQLTRQTATLQRDLERNGLLPRDKPIETPFPERPLDLVQRLVVLRRGGPFQNASLNPLTELAERAVELRLEPGTVLWREGEPSDYGVNIVHGIVACSGDGGKRRFRMGPGSVLGTLETMGQLPRSYDAVAETQLVALRGNVENLFDLLEDNFDLGRSFLSFLASVLDKLYERAAVVQRDEG